MGEVVLGEVVEVVAQLQEAAFGGLPALEFQGDADPAPGDLLGAGGTDQPALVQLELVAQRTDDQERGQHAGLVEVRLGVAGELDYSVVLGGDACKVAVGDGELLVDPGQLARPLVWIVRGRSV
ncbi:hypothetical protein ACWCQK_39335 [Streptomyces sp. NPDC002306]